MKAEKITTYNCETCGKKFDRGEEAQEEIKKLNKKIEDLETDLESAKSQLYEERMGEDL